MVVLWLLASVLCWCYAGGLVAGCCSTLDLFGWFVVVCVGWLAAYYVVVVLWIVLLVSPLEGLVGFAVWLVCLVVDCVL